MVAAGMASSRSEARRAVEQGGVSVKGEKVTDIKASYTKDMIGAEEFIVTAPHIRHHGNLQVRLIVSHHRADVLVVTEFPLAEFLYIKQLFRSL